MFLNEDQKQRKSVTFNMNVEVEVEVEEHVSLQIEENVTRENAPFQMNYTDKEMNYVTKRKCIKETPLEVKTDDQKRVKVFKRDFTPILLPSVNVFKTSLLFQTHVNANRTFCAITPTLIIAIKESKISLHTAKILLYMMIGTTNEGKAFTVEKEKLFDLFIKIYETVPGLNKMRFSNYNITR